MNTKKFSIVLAAFMLILVQLACAAGEPALSNTRTAFDENGEQTASTFGAFDTVYVVSDLANGAVGNVVTSRWYAENAEGVEANLFLDEADVTITENDAPFNGPVYFFFPPPTDGWPTGTYRVEVFFNGTPSATVTFNVQ